LSCYKTKSWLRVDDREKVTAFRVCVNARDHGRIKDASLWSKGIVVRDWIFRRNASVAMAVRHIVHTRVALVRYIQLCTHATSLSGTRLRTTSVARLQYQCSRGGNSLSLCVGYHGHWTWDHVCPDHFLGGVWCTHEAY